MTNTTESLCTFCYNKWLFHLPPLNMTSILHHFFTAARLVILNGSESQTKLMSNALTP